LRIHLGRGRDGIHELLDQVLLVAQADGLELTARSMAARISLSSPVPLACQVALDQHQDVIDVDLDLLDQLDLEHHVVVDRFLLGLVRAAEFGVQVQVEALVVLKIPLAEDLVAREVVEGREDVLQPQDRAEQLDERLLRRLAVIAPAGTAPPARRPSSGIRVVVGVGLEQHDALGVLVAEQRQRVVGGLLQIAEGDDVAVGLDRIEDAVGARIRLDQPVRAGSCPPTGC
jgi:hypothetical protein